MGKQAIEEIFFSFVTEENNISKTKIRLLSGSFTFPLWHSFFLTLGLAPIWPEFFAESLQAGLRFCNAYWEEFRIFRYRLLTDFSSTFG